MKPGCTYQGKSKLNYLKLLAGTDLNESFRFVLLMMINESDANLENAHPGRAKLVDDTGYSLSTVKRALQDLAEKGWIEKTSESNSHPDRNWNDVYRLTVPVGWEAERARLNAEQKAARDAKRAERKAARAEKSASKTQAKDKHMLQPRPGFKFDNRGSNSTTGVHPDEPPTGFISSGLPTSGCVNYLRSAAPSIIAEPSRLPDDWRPQPRHYRRADEREVDMEIAERKFREQLYYDRRSNWDGTFMHYLDAGADRRESELFPVGICDEDDYPNGIYPDDVAETLAPASEASRFAT